MKPFSRTPRHTPGFTLVEMMVSTAIIIVLLIGLAQITGQTNATWRYTASKTEQFREARTALDTMNRRISQATLNTYWDYDSPIAPTELLRRSELRFVSGPLQNGDHRLDAGSSAPRPTHGIFFQAPFGYVSPVNSQDTVSSGYQGLETLLNTWGYYIEVNDDGALRPPFLDPVAIPQRIGYRLMEFMQPASAMSLYGKTSGASGRDYAGFDWFRAAFEPPGAGINAALPTSHVLAENILTLIILPKLSSEDAAANLPAERRETALAPNYFYHSGEIGAATSETEPALRGLLNSKHQLPPVLQITVVALDEVSARKANLRTKSDDRFGVLTASFAVNAGSYRKDLCYDPNDPATSVASLEKRLIDQRLNYRIFTSNVHCRGAKWSKLQTK